MMCNPAEFFVDIMSKNAISSENDKYERKWFPSILLEQMFDDKTNKMLDDKANVMQDELANKEMDLLVSRTGMGKHFKYFYFL